MKLVIDDQIPFIRGIFETAGTVVYLPGDAMTPTDVSDADALVVRTRTHVGPALLENSPVRYVASATSGVDHLDTAWLEMRGITWSHCPGVNAESVAQYVTAALLVLSARLRRPLEGLVLGVVGAGHVGTRVIAKARALGMAVLVHDLPREAKEGPGNFVSLEDVRRQADVVSLHVPLRRTGPYRTMHLVDGAFLESMRRGAILMNTARGAVIRSAALREAIDRAWLGGVVLDVWEHEPSIDRALLEMVDLGTPHIAGYSTDAKARATAMVVEQISGFFDLDARGDGSASNDSVLDLDLDGLGSEGLHGAVTRTYDLEADDRWLRCHPDGFEQRRADYPVRREFDRYRVRGAPGALRDTLRRLGFQ